MEIFLSYDAPDYVGFTFNMFLGNKRIGMMTSAELFKDL